MRRAGGRFHDADGRTSIRGLRTARLTAAATLGVSAVSMSATALPGTAAPAMAAPEIATFACSLSGPLTSTPAYGVPDSYYWSFQLGGSCRDQLGRQFPAQATADGAEPGVQTGQQPQPDGACSQTGHFVGGLPDFIVGLDLTDPATGAATSYPQWWALEASPGLDGTSVDVGSPVETVAQLTVSSFDNTQLQQGASVGPGWGEGGGTFATRIFGACPGPTTSSSNLSVTTTFTPTVASSAP